MRWFLSEEEYDAIKNKKLKYCGTIFSGYAKDCCLTHTKKYYFCYGIIVTLIIYTIALYLLLR